MKIHLIIYQPGYAGHLLEYLFSLDQSTVPNGSNNDVTSRLDSYSFSHATKFSNWETFHHNYSISKEKDLKNIPQGYQHLVYSIHPTEFSRSATIEKLKLSINTALYMVKLTRNDFNDYWLMKTKEYWNGYPYLRSEEIIIEEDILTTYNPIIISMDALLDINIWQDEYIKINSLMGLPEQLEAARELYQSWYDLRVTPLRKEFDSLTQEQIKSYSVKRDKMELNSRNSIDPYWTVFYNRVQGSDWPDCNDERDFHQLPDWVQKELIEKFNYYPRSPRK